MPDPPNLLIQEFPHDPLSEIFIACLPEDPLEILQPDINQPPMLFTRICSHWRSVAVSTPKLWASLHHIAQARPASNVAGGPPLIGARDIAFLRWWTERVGGIKPSLRLGLNMSSLLSRSTRGRITRPFPIALDPMEHRFFYDLIDRAVLPDLDYHYIMAIQFTFFGGRERALEGPNLETLCIRQCPDRSHDQASDTDIPLNPDVFDTDASIPIPSDHISLRRFYIEDLCISGDQVRPNRVMPWKNLTHISAINLSVTQDAWLELIHACTSMVSGYFSINRMTTGDNHITPRPTCLPHVRRLVFRVPLGGDSMVSPFYNLELPALTSLRLETFPPANFEYLERILPSTPALKELQLGTYHPSNDSLRGDQRLPLPEEMQPHGVIRPLWNFVPKLEIIHFAGVESKAPESPQYPPLVKQALETPWLGLARRHNQIKIISFEADGIHNQEEIEAIVGEVMQSGEIPEGVEVVVRRPTDYPLWGRSEQYDRFWLTGSINRFDDLGFVLSSI